jgi:hypothetical protein
MEPLDIASLSALWPNEDIARTATVTAFDDGSYRLDIPEPAFHQILNLTPSESDLIGIHYTVTDPISDADDLACSRGQAVDPNLVMGCTNNNTAAETTEHPSHNDLTTDHMDNIQQLVLASLRLYNCNLTLADTEVKTATAHFDNLTNTQ